jgi:hypothetical protein
MKLRETSSFGDARDGEFEVSDIRVSDLFRISCFGLGFPGSPQTLGFIGVQASRLPNNWCRIGRRDACTPKLAQSRISFGDPS